MSTTYAPCARNLPQHFNGCTCTPAPGGVTAEAAEVDLVSTSAYDDIYAEGEAWEAMKYAEMGRLLAQQDLTAAKARPRLLRRRKRIAAMSTDVERANAKVTETRRAQVDAYYRVDARPSVDAVERHDREVAIAHRHAAIVGRMIGLAVFDRDNDTTTRRQRERIQRGIDFLNREHNDTRLILRDVRATRDRVAAASEQPPAEPDTTEV